MPHRVRSETAADRELIEAAARESYTVSARRLRRWRSEGLLPHRSVKSRGRGGGVEGVDSVGTVEQLLALCRWQQVYPRSADRIAVSLWYDGWPVPTERVRSAVLHGFETARKEGRIDWDREPVSPLEMMAGQELSRQNLDPAELQTPTRLVRDARTDLSDALFGETDSIDDRLVGGYLQLERLDAALPADGLPRFDVDVAIPQLNLDEVIEDLRNSTDGELEGIRAFLRSTYEGLAEVRVPDADIDLSQVSPALAEAIPLIDMTADTRHPDFDAGKLLAAIGSGLTIFRLFYPPALRTPQ
jgi:hypothetical protein